MLLSALQPLLCFSNGTAVEGVGGVVSKMPSDGLLRRVAEANSSGVRFAMSLAGGNGRLEAQARAEVHLQRRQGQRQTHTQWEDELRLQPEHQSQLQPNPNPERGRNLAVTQKTVAKERERREMVGGKKEELAADGNNDAGKEEPWEEASGEASGEQGAWEKTVGRGQGGDETLAATGAQSVPPSLAVTSPTCPWSVNLHDFSEMMTMSVVVTIGGTHRDAGTLAAVVKSSVRGTQDTPKSPLFGPYAGRGVFQITIHANEGGETVGFVFTDGSTRTILDETLTFVVDADQGSVVSPFALTAAAGGAPIQWDWTGSCRQIILTSLLSPEPPPLPALSVADILVQERVARLTASGGVNVILDTVTRYRIQPRAPAPHRASHCDSPLFLVYRT